MSILKIIVNGKSSKLVNYELSNTMSYGTYMQMNNSIIVIKLIHNN